MTNNDILRRIRFILDFSDSKMMELFTLPNEVTITRSQISDWLKKDEDPAFVELDDYHLAIFLNGLINEKRGKKEKAPEIERVLNNNIILRKLKIAFNLENEGIIEILKLVNLKISKHELSAFFRNPTQPQYRLCGNQVLRNFLMGLQIKHAR